MGIEFSWLDLEPGCVHLWSKTLKSFIIFLLWNESVVQKIPRTWCQFTAVLLGTWESGRKRAEEGRGACFLESVAVREKFRLLGRKSFPCGEQVFCSE